MAENEINNIDNTQALEVQVPENQVPVTAIPDTQEPVVEASVTSTPATEAQVEQTPVTSTPDTKSPDTKSPANKKSKEDKKAAKEALRNQKRTTIGGQALIEGIMMCGPRRTAMAVRKADGSIHVEEIKQSDKVVFWEKVPFVRGSIKFYKMLVTGTAALMRSADLSEEGAPETDEKDKGKKPSKLEEYLSQHTDIVITLSAILGIILSVGLFILLPRLLVDTVMRFTGLNDNGTLLWSVLMNLLEGVLRIIIFLIYLISVSKLEDIRRVWMYHGAEHKTIACYEAGEALTVENIKKFRRFHPRCGTAFMFIVLAISILIYTLTGMVTGDNNMLLNLVVRLILIPFICGISYEILRFVGRHDDNLLCKILCKPGLWLQKFTTNEPDDKIIEVAILAMEAVIPENANDDNW